MVALDGRYQCQSYARISTGGFDDSGAGLQNALLFCILNHRQCDTVLHATAGVEKLYFGNHWGRQTLCP